MKFASISPAIRRPRGFGACLPHVLATLLSVLSSCAFAMQEIEDGDLSTVSGRDGLTAILKTPTGGISATCMYLALDPTTLVWPSGATACTTGSPTDSGANAYFSFIRAEGLQFSGVGLQGASPGAATSITTTFDVASNNQTAAGSLNGIGITTTWQRSRLYFSALRQKANLNNSIGAVAFDSSGSLTYFSRNGMFDFTQTGSTLNLQLSNAELYYRQQGSELVISGLNANMGFPASGSAKFGITPAGIQLTSNRFDFNLLYNIGYRSSPASPLTTASGFLPMLQYGWSGGLTNVKWSMTGGGINGQGLTLSIQDDADTDFKWIVGDVPGSSTYTMTVQFGGWTKLPGATYGLSAPSNLIDVVNAGQGAGGISYMGAPATEIAPDSGALAVAIRNLSFLNYNTTVRIVDASYAGGFKDFNWGLIYALGKVDANLYLYPGGLTVPTEGVRFDLTLAVQSPGAWNQNTHFLLADTSAAVNAGVGFVNSNFWITIDNGYLELRPAGIRLVSGVGTAGDFDWKMSALFGGGSLANLSKPVNVFNLGLNLHASSIDLTLSPPPAGSSYVGFNWLAHLYEPVANTPSSADSFISFAEPSRPTVLFNMNQLSGDLAVINGSLNTMAGNESADLQPRLVFTQTMEFGTTAVPTTGTPVIFNAISIGTTPIMSTAIPGGKFYVSLGLKEEI